MNAYTRTLAHTAAFVIGSAAGAVTVAATVQLIDYIGDKLSRDDWPAPLNPMHPEHFAVLDAARRITEQAARDREREPKDARQRE